MKTTNNFKDLAKLIKSIQLCKSILEKYKSGAHKTYGVAAPCTLFGADRRETALTYVFCDIC